MKNGENMVTNGARDLLALLVEKGRGHIAYPLVLEQQQIEKEIIRMPKVVLESMALKHHGLHKKRL